MQQEKQETTFLSEQGVKVTSSRFILPSQTFAMSGITSVQSSIEKPKRLVPIIFLAVGTLLLVSTPKETWQFDVLCLAVGGVWFALQKTIYHVLLHTSSGQAKALSSKDEQWISKVVHALNDSIVHRG
jgi:predicted membrane channel-forming protein YqfA (hemolysin III family)